MKTKFNSMNAPMTFDTTKDLSVNAPQIFRQMEVGDVAVFKAMFLIGVQSCVNRIHKSGRAHFTRQMSRDNQTFTFTRTA